MKTVLFGSVSVMSVLLNSKSYIIVRDKDNSLVGCEIVLNRDVLTAGITLYLYYNSLKDAMNLVNKGKLYYLGVLPTSDFKGTLDEFNDLLLSESKYNVNYYNRETISFSENLGCDIERLGSKDYKKIKEKARSLFIFEDNAWFVYLKGFTDDKVSLSDLFSCEDRFQDLCAKVLPKSITWDVIQKRITWYRYLHDIDVSGYQLASKIELKQVYLDSSLALSVEQIPFQTFNNNDSNVDYYVAVDKDLSVLYVTKKWVKENICKIKNAEVDSGSLCFVMNKRGVSNEHIE